VPLEELAAQLHRLLGSLGVEQPIVVGHSMSGGLACVYAAAHPVRGVVVVDSGPDLQPFAELLQRLAPALRGPGFTSAWATFENSLGLERVPEPLRAAVLAGRRVDQEVVLGYWEPLLRADPAQLQAWIDDEIIPRIDKPCLGVFGRPVTERERERLARLADVRLEEWPGDGHCVHLVDPDRFAASLRRFVEHCTSAKPSGKHASLSSPAA
jgi:pimeloyl-ACP methyl ester carboxylesterase